MCKFCLSAGLNRREFLAAGGAVSAMGVMSSVLARQSTATFNVHQNQSPKDPARVLVAFLYPPAEVVNGGKLEDGWAPHHWFTWPGNQFKPEEQERKFTQAIQEMSNQLGIEIEFAPQAIYQQAKVEEFIQQAKAKQPDAVLIVNFWNSFSKWSHQMATEAAPTAIVYHSVGSNHQLPPEYLRKAEGLYYIHSIENFDEIRRGLLAVRAKKMLAQSRLLRVSGGLKEKAEAREERLGIDIVGVPAGEFNAIFDAIKPDDELVQQAMKFKKAAAHVTDVTDQYFIEAFRSHHAVDQIMQKYAADAITIQCLFLKHRKPCISFALNNGNLIPCGCENHLEGTLTMMLGRWLLERPGFMHNPEFDTSQNLYFASHCTCAWQLHGPQADPQPFDVRPFFHQLPKTAALDVQWTPDDPILLTKYHTQKGSLSCWTGRVVESPSCPPTGGCATRVLMDVDRVEDICDVYRGPHPILFCGDRGDAQRLKAFAKMYRFQLEGNV